MKRRLYDLVRRASQKAVQDVNRVQWFVAGIGARLMLLTDKERTEYETACVEQEADLHELKILAATLAVKEHALAVGGFDEAHGPALAMAANALVEQCDWDDESVMDWFGALVMDENGENLGADIHLDDGEE